MGSEFKKRLAALKGKWNKAKKEKPESFGAAVEDGTYVGRLTLAELGESQSSGRMQVTWEATITEGENKGVIVRDYDGLETEQNLFFFQAKLARFGKEIPDGDNIEEIEEILAELTKEKPAIRFRVQTKDDFTHFRINRLLKDSDTEEVEEKEEEEAPEEVVAEPAAEAEAEAEPEEKEDEGTIQLKKGMKVTFESGGKEVEGEVLEFIDDDTRARIQTDKGVFKVKLEKLSPVEGEDAPVETEPEPEEEAEPEPAPKKVRGKVTKVGGRK